MHEDLFQLGIKALITNVEGKVLLLKVDPNRLIDVFESYWDIPGGRLHRGAEIEETLRREVEEETCVREIRDIQPFAMVLSNIRIPRGESDTGLILSVYRCTIEEGAEITLSEEHVEYGWFDMDEAAKLLSVKYPKEFTELLCK